MSIKILIFLLFSLNFVLSISSSLFETIDKPAKGKSPSLNWCPVLHYPRIRAYIIEIKEERARARVNAEYIFQRDRCDKSFCRVLADCEDLYKGKFQMQSGTNQTSFSNITPTWLSSFTPPPPHTHTHFLACGQTNINGRREHRQNIKPATATSVITEDNISLTVGGIYKLKTFL